MSSKRPCDWASAGKDLFHEAMMAMQAHVMACMEEELSPLKAKVEKLETEIRELREAADKPQVFPTPYAHHPSPTTYIPSSAIGRTASAAAMCSPALSRQPSCRPQTRDDGE